MELILARKPEKLCSQALIHDCGPLVAAICPPKALSLGIYPQFPPSGDESGQNPKNALKICASLRCNLLKYSLTSTQPCANRSAFTLDLHARPSRSAFTRVQCPAFTRIMRSDVTSTASPRAHCVTARASRAVGAPWLSGGPPSCYTLDSGFWGIAALHRLSLWGDPHPAVTVGGPP